MYVRCMTIDVDSKKICWWLL